MGEQIIICSVKSPDCHMGAYMSRNPRRASMARSEALDKVYRSSIRDPRDQAGSVLTSDSCIPAASIRVAQVCLAYVSS